MIASAGHPRESDTAGAPAGSAPSAPVHLLRVDEVADFFRISRGTVYQWIKMGHLKAVSVPGEPLRVVKDSIRDLLARCRE